MPELSSASARYDAKFRIFLADDHPVVREGLKALIATQPTMAVVGEAKDGQCACQEIERLRPDVVIWTSPCRS